ncbi:hypothetical protein DXG03_000289 [Asterophora parasitica]|uniref:Uncharacterized protein n=1 Tax=Asterophora parasitica TaxID=117018 RepID=A0A9P7GKF8_9AGAR|nr:hypothetical protein DXG03_000289 [Asterophora parasitica]
MSTLSDIPAPCPSKPPVDLQSTLTLLDDLVRFYHNEREWIQRTRAAIDDAYQPDPSQSLPSPPPTDSDDSSDSSDDKPMCDSDVQSQSSATPQTSQWSQRNKGLKMQLDASDKPPKPHVRRIASHSDYTRRKQLLEGLDRAMEARLESCHRVSRLVRNANRADLHYR